MYKYTSPLYPLYKQYKRFQNQCLKNFILSYKTMFNTPSPFSLHPLRSNSPSLSYDLGSLKNIFFKIKKKKVKKYFLEHNIIQKRILSFWCDSTSSLTILMVSSGFLNWNNNMIEVNKRNSFKVYNKRLFSSSSSSYAMFSVFFFIRSFIIILK